MVITLVGRAAVIGIVVLGWQFLSRSLGPETLPGLIEIGRRLLEVTANGDLWRHSLATLIEAGGGLLIGGAAGVLGAVVLRRLPRLDAAFAPILAGAMAVPKLAIAPVLMLWLGIGFSAKLAFVAIGVFFPVFFSTTSGLRAIDPRLVAISRVMGGARWILAREVLLPGAIPFIFASVKVAAPHAITVAVIGEFISSNEGLGYYVHASASQADTIGILTGVTIITAIVVAVSAGLERVERVLLRPY
jgi:NitT/TauT family transport system permease protein